MAAVPQSAVYSGKEYSLCVVADAAGVPSIEWRDFALETWASSPTIPPTILDEVFVWLNPFGPGNACVDTRMVIQNVAKHLRALGVLGHCRWTMVIHRPLLPQISLILQRIKCLDEYLALELVPPPGKGSCGAVPWDFRLFRILSRGLVESVAYRDVHSEKAAADTFNQFAQSPTVFSQVFATEREILEFEGFHRELAPHDQSCVMALPVPDIASAWSRVKEFHYARQLYGQMGCWTEAYRLPAFIASSLRACHLRLYLHARTSDELLTRGANLKIAKMPAGAEKTHYSLCVFMRVAMQQKWLDQALVTAETWAAATADLDDVAVFFMLPEGTGEVHPTLEKQSVRLVGDYHVGYQHQAVRDLMIWQFFATHPNRPRCDWVARVDTDTWVNLQRLRDRLRCFADHREHHVGWPSLAWPRLGGLLPGRMFLYHLNAVVLNRKLMSRMAAQNGFMLCLSALVQDWLGQGLNDELLSDCIWKTLRIWPEFLGDRGELANWDGPPKELRVNDCIIFAHPASVPLMRLLHSVTLRDVVGQWSIKYANELSAIYSISHSGRVNMTSREGGFTSQLFFLHGMNTTNHSFALRLQSNIQEEVTFDNGRLLVKRWDETSKRLILGFGTKVPDAKVTVACNQLLPRDTRLNPWCQDNGTSLALAWRSHASKVTESSPDCWSFGDIPVLHREWCCHELFGPRGNPVCWTGSFTYERCCLGLTVATGR